MVNRHFPISKLYLLRMLFLLSLVVFVTTMASRDIVSADGEEPHPALTDDVPQIDMSDTELLINLKISVDPTEGLTLENHHFREDVLNSPIAVPWFWAARVITFDNRCSILTPLEDPTISRYVDPETSHEHWGSNTTATELEVELPVDAGMHEIEILNSDYEVVAKYNAAVFLDSFCDGDPDNPLCKLRKSLLILLDDDDGMEDFSVDISDSFQDLEHLEKVSNREGYKLLSSDDTPLYLVDLSQTSFPWDQAHSTTNPFESPSGKGLYNGYKSLRSGAINESEGSLIISLEQPARGIGMKIGFMTPSQVMKKDEVALDMSNILAGYEDDIPSDILEKVSNNLVGKKDPVVANFAVYDSDGEKINSAKKMIVPVPGLHTFVGLITPNNNISYVEIKYEDSSNPEDASAEFITDVLLFTPDAEKVDPRPYKINEKPCESPILLYTGPIADFQPLPELERLVLPEPQEDNLGDVEEPIATPTITPPDPDLLDPETRSVNGRNPLAAGSSAQEPVVENRTEPKTRDDDTQVPAGSCNASSFGDGGKSSSEGIAVGIGLVSLFSFIKRRRMFAQTYRKSMPDDLTVTTMN